MTYNSSTLTLACTSTGGPATNVTWMKDGELLVTDGTTYQQRQMVVDMQQAVYDNMLTFQSEAVDGNYSCQVSNLRSSQSKDIIIGGKLFCD